MRIQLLLTGNELMSGDTVDSNSAGIAQQLSRHGLAVYRKVTVGDDAGLLLAAGLDAVKGDVSKKKELITAMERARIDSPRGAWTTTSG